MGSTQRRFVPTDAVCRDHWVDGLSGRNRFAGVCRVSWRSDGAGFGMADGSGLSRRGGIRRAGARSGLFDAGSAPDLVWPFQDPRRTGTVGRPQPMASVRIPLAGLFSTPFWSLAEGNYDTRSSGTGGLDRRETFHHDPEIRPSSFKDGFHPNKTVRMDSGLR